MIRATVQSQSSDRDDALKYLYNKLKSVEWGTWKRDSDIFLTEKRSVGTRFWIAKTTVIRDEEER